MWLPFITNAYLAFFLIILWCIGLPLFLAQSRPELYEVKFDKSVENSNEICTGNIVEQKINFKGIHYNNGLHLTDEAFTCYASFLTLILKSCHYDKCGTLTKMKLENSFMSYLALGKGNDCNLQNFPLQQFLQQTEVFILSYGIDNMVQRAKMIASENEKRFYKTNLMNFASICRKEIDNPAPVQRAVKICNAIE